MSTEQREKENNAILTQVTSRITQTQIKQTLKQREKTGAVRSPLQVGRL